MAQPKQKQPPIDLGIYSRNEKSPRITMTEVVAISLSLLWIAAVAGFLLIAQAVGAPPVDSLQFVMTLLAIFLPVALIWVAASAARSSRAMREDTERLHIAIEALRSTYIQTQQHGATGIKPAISSNSWLLPSFGLAATCCSSGLPTTVARGSSHWAVSPSLPVLASNSACA